MIQTNDVSSVIDASEIVGLDVANVNSWSGQFFFALPETCVH